MNPQDERTITETELRSAVEVTPSGRKNVVMDSQILTSLMTCARLTDLRFNLNLVSINGKSNSIECGSIVHKFLEVYYHTVIKGMDRKRAVEYGMAAAEMYIQGCRHCTGFTPHACDCIVLVGPNIYGPPNPACTECNGKGIIDRPKCNHKPNDYPGVKNTPAEPDPENPRETHKTGWKWVLETCLQYCDYYKNDSWVPLETEVVKQKVLYLDDEVRVLWKAKLDLTSDTNKGIFPVDHKTMKQRRNTLSLNNQFKGQCLIMGTRNVVINKVGFQTTLKPEEKFERKMMSYSEPRLLEWQGEILPFYAKLLLMYVESGYFPPNFSNCEGKYGNCAFCEVCEADPNDREDILKKNFIVGPVWDPRNEEGDA